MKAILEFDCSNEYENELLMRSLLSTELCSVIFEMQNYFKGRIKNCNLKTAEEELYDAQEKLYDLLYDKNINFEKIYT